MTTVEVYGKGGPVLIAECDDKEHTITVQEEDGRHIYHMGNEYALARLLIMTTAKAVYAAR